MQAAAETYIGLVEVGVGLIPAGGGTKEMLARAVEHDRRSRRPISLPYVQRVFETIGFAKVSTSAADARRLGYLRDGRRDHDEPRAADRRREGASRSSASREGYQRRAPRTAIPVGGDGVLARAQARRAPRLARRPHQRSRALIGRDAGQDPAGGIAAAPDDA